MPASFPAALKTYTNPQDDVTEWNAARVDEIHDEIEAIEAELGTDPAGASATVKARLDAMDAAIAAAGEVDGTGAAAQVAFWTDADTLTGDADFAFDGSQLALAVQGLTGGVLMGGDVQIYRAAANLLQTPDSAKVEGGLSLGTASGAATGELELSGAIRESTLIGALAYHDANQSLSDNTLTALNLNQERWDTDTIHDTVTNNTRLTCKTAGKYLIVGCVEFASNATGRRFVGIRLGGSTYLAVNSQPPVDGNATSHVASCVYELAVNEYVELIALQNSGGALNSVTQTYSPTFAMMRIP